MNRGGTSIASWRFEETGASAGVQLPLASFPTFFFDYDNDGSIDLFVPSYDVNAAMHEMVAREYLDLPLQVRVSGVDVGFEDSKLYRNKGDGTFVDVTTQVGLHRKVIFAMGSNFGDLDNDGFIDLYIGTGNPDLRSVIQLRIIGLSVILIFSDCLSKINSLVCVIPDLSYPLCVALMVSFSSFVSAFKTLHL